MYKKICTDEYKKRLPALEEAYRKLPDEYKKYFVVPELWHLEYVADNLIEEHRKELAMLGGTISPREALNRAFSLSTKCCFSLVIYDKVMGIGGIGGSNDIWLLLCKDALESKVMQSLLTKEAKTLLDYFINTYASDGFLENIISHENTKQRKWLEFLGAVTTPVKFNGVDVIAFTFIRNQGKGCDA